MSQALNFSRSTYERALAALLLLNMADAVFTSWWVKAGWADEANPVMAVLLELGLWPFMLTKLGVGAMAVLFLKSHADRRLARVGVATAVILYFVVVAFHVHQSASQYLLGTLLTVAY